MPSVLVLGGARSGKSRRALTLIEGMAASPVFIATAEAFDSEMADRIACHQAERDGRWRTREAPLDVAEALAVEARPGNAVLVDCLTLWLSNVMHAERDVEVETGRLVTTIENAAAPVVLVSNEVGLGLVPETPLGRAFRDHQGRLNQAIAAVCDRVEFVAAGLPLVLKG